MREAELANLLIQMAGDQGLPVAVAAEEIAALPLPAWIDAPRVRSALVDAVERQMRSQMESQLDQLRQRMLRATSFSVPTPDTQPPMAPPPTAVTNSSAAAVSPAVAVPPVAVAMQTMPPPPAETPAATPPTPVREIDLPPGVLPPDSTRVWTTQHGRPPEDE